MAAGCCFAAGTFSAAAGGVSLRSPPVEARTALLCFLDLLERPAARSLVWYKLKACTFSSTRILLFAASDNAHVTACMAGRSKRSKKQMQASTITSSASTCAASWKN
eukprot:scaffold48356_cov63-Phaeocystis_antarctica.AAC.5